MAFHYDVKKMTVLLGSEDIQVGTLGQMYLLNSQYFWKWTNANPMKIFRQPASHPKLLIGSKLSLD